MSDIGDMIEDPRRGRPQHMPIEQVRKELTEAGIDCISSKQAGKLIKQIADLLEVYCWTQAVLTAWNTGPLPQECELHKKLREVLINYRKVSKGE